MKRIYEKTIVQQCLRYLNTLPGCYARKNHGSGWQRRGEADITGCLMGQRLEIEVKGPDGKLTELQIRSLRRWRDAGAITGVARSVEDVIRILEQATTEKDGSKRGAEA